MPTDHSHGRVSRESGTLCLDPAWECHIVRVQPGDELTKAHSSPPLQCRRDPQRRLRDQPHPGIARQDGLRRIRASVIDDDYLIVWTALRERRVHCSAQPALAIPDGDQPRDGHASPT
jgi:hypothetical protein